MIETLGYFGMAWTDPWLLFLVGIGTFLGIYIGAIPGLSVTMAVSILISFTFAWEVNDALALMVGIFMGGVYGGSRTAILLNIPGAPSAIATALDGYPLALKGQAGEAIGVSTVMSAFGGLIGVAALALFAPMISDFALTFQPRDAFPARATSPSTTSWRRSGPPATMAGSLSRYSTTASGWPPRVASPRTASAP